jgi:SAM-dependent methyltransferase
VTEPERREANEQLIEYLHVLVAQLQSDQSSGLPVEEPYLASGSALKGGVKRGVFRATRPATRRYDRLATDLARVSLELAEQLETVTADIDRLRGDVDRLDHAVGSLRSSVVGTEGLPGSGVAGAAQQIPDAYYWAFEARMRGSSESVLDRMRGYERRAVSLRDEFHTLALADDADPRPLWLDLGCGLGEFGELVREWGWRVEGVDNSPQSVEACRARDIDATLADVSEFLATRRGEAPAAISAIQLIEHLPRGAWIELFERIHRSLADGGAMLVETINGLNAEALTTYFLADVTHTWPGHPETLTLMAEHAGFDRVEVIFMNPDERGNPQDFAVWARKAARGAGSNTTEP